MFKKLFLLTFPVLAAGAPMAYYSGPEWLESMTASMSVAHEESAAPEKGGGSQEGKAAGGQRKKGTPKATPAAQGLPVEGYAVGSFLEVLRFDITPAWITSRWPRVSSDLAQLQLQGYRVPLVTGTAVDDLAGSLTYYFDAKQQVSRITFQGTTGDFGRLAQTLMASFGFVRRPTNTPSVVLFEAPGKSAEEPSYLWIETAPVIKADDLHGRYKLSLVLERPGEADESGLFSGWSFRLPQKSSRREAPYFR